MQLKPRPFRAAGRFLRPAAILWTLAAPAVFAQTTNVITLLTNDAVGSASFTGATNWSNLAPPVTGSPNVNAYFTTNFTLRTPSGSGSYVFQGDLLSLDTNGVLAVNGSGTITVNNLLLDGGSIQNVGTGGSPDTAVVAGSITAENILRADSFLNGGATSGVTRLNVLAPIKGPGAITVNGSGTVLLSASNSYAGQTQVNSGVLKANNSNAIPLSVASGDNIGNLRVNWQTVAAGVTNAAFDLNGFDVAANQLITGSSNANSIAPIIINSAAGKTNTLTVGLGDGNGFTWRGLILDNQGGGGAVALTKAGSGTFQLFSTVGSLSYSGDTTLAGGTVNMGASLALPWGAGKGNLIVNSPCTLNLSGRSETVNGFSGDGTIDDTGTTGRSTLSVGSNDVSSVFSGVIQNSQANVGANQSIVSLQKNGRGTFTLTGNNSFSGPVTINNGILAITQSSGLGSVPKTGNNNITSSAGDAQLHLVGTNGNISLDPGLVFQTAGTNGAIVNEAGSNTVNGPILLQSGGNTTIRSDAGTLTLAGSVSILANTSSRTLTLGGAAGGMVTGVIADNTNNVLTTTNLSLAKAGAGSWTLATNDTYSGITTISGGSLVLGGSGSVSNTPDVVLQAGGVFDVSAVPGGWTLGAGQILSGSGTVDGSVSTAGQVAPGTINTTGALVFANTLTLAGTAVMKLNRTNVSLNADSITAATLARGGALVVTNIGDPLQGGDTFNLLHGSFSGAFASTNLPPLAGPLFWDTSFLGSQGTLKVGSSAVPQPHLTGVSLSGTSLVITGTNGSAGAQYHVLTSTNPAVPLSQWTVLPAGTFGGASFTITNTVNPGARQNYYILRVP